MTACAMALTGTVGNTELRNSMHRYTQRRLRRKGKKEPQKQDEIGISTHKIMREEEAGGSTAGNYRHNEVGGSNNARRRKQHYNNKTGRNN